MREIDFHAHILPSCDHGSDGWETSRRQLKLARGAGVEIVCATSHFYGHHISVEDFLQKRQRCYEELMAHAPKGSPRVLLGAEVLAFEGIERLPGLEALRLEGTRLLLLEMPFTHWSESLLDSVEALADNEDFRIVLAHVDRYDKEAVERLLRRNRLLGQVNTDSFKKIFGTRHLQEWVRQGRIVAMGSDIHGAQGGYEDWVTCRVRNAEAWETIMERTNALLQGSL